MRSWVKRASSFFILLLGIWVINFLLVVLTPGDATNLYFGPGTGKGTVESLQQQRGLDRPLFSQFLYWTSKFLAGDLGYSWTRHQPVSEVILDALPATLQLTLLALVFNMFVGTLWGLLAGLWFGRVTGSVLSGAGVVLYAVPTFFLASILVLLFGVGLGWLPVAGLGQVGAGDENGIWLLVDRLKHLVLPVVALGLTGAAATARFTRSKVVEALHEGYVRQATANGLPRSVIILRHLLPNALLPIITLVGLHLPFLLGGAFVVEVIFAWPGLGRIMFESFLSRDYPVIFSTNLLVALAAASGSLVADSLYRIADPRIRYD